MTSEEIFHSFQDDIGPLHMEQYKFMRIFNGTVLLLSCTITIIKQDNALDLFLDFTALMFICDIDALMYTCLKLGLFGVESKKLTKTTSLVKWATTRQDGRWTNARYVRYTVIIRGLIV